MKRIVIISTGVLVVVLGGVIAFLSTNYYSVLADVREQFVTVDQSDAYAYGESLFQTRGCTFCHTLDAVGSNGDAGPPLNRVGARLDSSSIRQSIVEPNAVIAITCPQGPCEPDNMPNYGAILDDGQILALVTYLSAQQ